jgi:hypothetical protein
MTDCCNVPEPQLAARYGPDEIILYGVNLNSRMTKGVREASIPFGKLSLASFVRDEKDTPLAPDKIALAVVYGYSFEGHCYRLDKPKLMIFEYGGEGEPATGCGFGGQYLMWRITTKTNLLELVVSADLAEELLLKANLPGNRNPTTYGASMQLAHRGGQLSYGRSP